MMIDTVPRPPSTKKHIFSVQHHPERSIHIELWSELALFLLLVIAVIVPSWKHVQLTAGDWNETRAESVLLERAVQDRQQVQTDIGAFEEQTILEAALPTEDQVIQYIESIENVATSTSVDARLTFHTSQRIINQGAVVIPLSLSVTGPFENTVRFLGALEEQPTYITPTALRYSRQSVDENSVLLNMDANSFWSNKL